MNLEFDNISLATGAEVMEDSEVLSRRAEIFRSKLIADFHLLESISEKGRRKEAPKYYTHDIINETEKANLMRSHPEGLVRFQVYHDKEQIQYTAEDRRSNRVRAKNSKYTPLDLWAHWVVKSSWFQNSMLALILMNCVVLGIQAELSDRSGPTVDRIRSILDIFDYCTLMMFVVEILLKWLDSFWDFWKNRWNIFDFCVTFLSFLPEFIGLFASGDSGNTMAAKLDVIATNLRTFRVMRSLKMVSRFQKVRLIVLAVTKAFQAMAFILVLLAVFAYIFAIVGVIFFNSEKSNTVSKSEQATSEMSFSNSFDTLWLALITLFQLFTLDHWLDIYNYATSVNYIFGFCYIFLWIIIGSFIFRNLFVGIMVNNFQSIRNDLFQEVEDLQQRERHDAAMAEFAEELDKQNQTQHPGIEVSKADLSNSDKNKDKKNITDSSRVNSSQELKEALSQIVNKAEKDSATWQSIVERNLENLAKEEASFCWPRDSLFKYFLMMESLQENLQERQQLLDLASEALLMVYDT